MAAEGNIGTASEHYVDVNGVNMFYQQKGYGNIPVVLVHGNLSSHICWEKLIEVMPEDKYTIYAPDLPGFGYSDKPEFDPTMEYYSDAIKGFKEEVGIDKFYFVGSSLGGPMGFCYAIEHTDDLYGLAVVGSPHPHGAEVPEAYLDFIETYKSNPGVLKKVIGTIIEGCDDEAFLDKLVESALQMDQDLIVKNAQSVSRFNYADQLKEIHTPVWISRGSNDIRTTQEMADMTKECFENAYITNFKNSTHTPYIEEPETFLAEFERFVENTKGN